MIAFYLKKHL